MNLFLVQWAPSETADSGLVESALSEFRGKTPFLSEASLDVWKAPSGLVAIGCLRHSGDAVGGVEYMRFRERQAALFAGRPYVWADEARADGRSPLEPDFYLQAGDDWLTGLDGRFVVVRYDDEEGVLDLASDPFGTHLVFRASTGEVSWFSSNSALLRDLVESRGSRPTALASFLACGWSIGGDPRWAQVERLAPGHLHSLRRGSDLARRRRLAPDRPALFEAEFDPKGAARDLVSVLNALADWPGRRNVVPVSGGRDSRLVFAAALRGDFDFDARTMIFPHLPGYPQTMDAKIANALCDAAGRPHEIIEQMLVVDIAEAAGLLHRLSTGVVSLELASQAVFARPVPTGGTPLELVHTGHGGELARAYYGVLEDATPRSVEERLYRRTTNLWPRPLLSKDGAQLYRSTLSSWVRDRVDDGVAPRHLGDLFYLEERMGAWIASSQGVTEYSYELTNPLLSRRLVPQEFALPADQRAREVFHLQMLEELYPDLARIGFDIQPPWLDPAGERQLRARPVRVMTKAVRELRRRVAHVMGQRPPGSARDPFPTVLAHTRAVALDRSSHEAWALLNRRRVERLLRRDPHVLDSRSRSLVWRLATVFLGDA